MAVYIVVVSLNGLLEAGDELAHAMPKDLRESEDYGRFQAKGMQSGDHSRQFHLGRTCRRQGWDWRWL